MICGAPRQEMVARPQITAFNGRSGAHVPISLHCDLAHGHDGDHSCILPSEALSDAGKRHRWPGESRRYEMCAALGHTWKSHDQDGHDFGDKVRCVRCHAEGEVKT